MQILIISELLPRALLETMYGSAAPSCVGVEAKSRLQGGDQKLCDSSLGICIKLHSLKLHLVQLHLVRLHAIQSRLVQSHLVTLHLVKLHLVMLRLTHS